MSISTVSAKGQITLPGRLRKQLRIGPQDRLSVEAVGDAIVIRRAPDLFALEGFLGKAVPRRLERRQMSRAVARHGKGRHR